MAGNLTRHPLQGVWTVVRFNWHLHAIALSVAAGFLTIAWFLSGPACAMALVAGSGMLISIALSLVATWWAYDACGLYRMDWLAEDMKGARDVANLHAGFDETSEWLKRRFPHACWQVFDFYDPDKHTEISIRRARRAHPPSGDTKSITTGQIPLDDRSLDVALFFLAAHEIRAHDERVGFFRELRRVLRPGGRVIITEHLRDVANIAVYSLGAWHFHSRREWLHTFEEAGFRVVRSFPNNRFIHTFVLEPS